MYYTSGFSQLTCSRNCQSSLSKLFRRRRFTKFTRSIAGRTGAPRPLAGMVCRRVSFALSIAGRTGSPRRAAVELGPSRKPSVRCSSRGVRVGGELDCRAGFFDGAAAPLVLPRELLRRPASISELKSNSTPERLLDFFLEFVCCRVRLGRDDVACLRRFLRREVISPCSCSCPSPSSSSSSSDHSP